MGFESLACAASGACVDAVGAAGSTTAAVAGALAAGDGASSGEALVAPVSAVVSPVGPAGDPFASAGDPFTSAGDPFTSTVEVGGSIVSAVDAGAGASRRPVRRSAMNDKRTMSTPATRAIAARRRSTRAGTNVESASCDPGAGFTALGEEGRSREDPAGAGRSTTTFGPAGSDVRARRTPCSA